MGEDGELHGVQLDVLRRVRLDGGRRAVHLDAHAAARRDVARALWLYLRQPVDDSSRPKNTRDIGVLPPASALDGGPYCFGRP